MHRGLLCGNPSARDPSPLAQDDMLGVRRLFHNNDSFGRPGHPDRTAEQACRRPAGASPRPTGAWLGPDALGWSCQADLQVPGGVMT